MDEARLKQLLKQADHGPPGTASDGVVAAVLHRRDSARRRSRMAAVASVVLAVTAGVAVYSHRPAEVTPTIARPASIEPDAAAWLAIADRVEAAERQGRAALATEWSRTAIAIERERAATILLSQGDWRRQQGGSGEAEYRRAAELFGGTRAAAAARAKLEQS